VGKAKAMDMVLTGRMIDAVEAERIGLVSRVVPLADLMTETLKAADKIAALSAPVIKMAKESVNHAFNSHLHDGISFERKLFYATFSLADQKEGMAAFVEKRPPNFTDQ
jgi:enoyl-CoA hydratase